MTAGRRLILLRHGEVLSHRGDQPLTDAGREQATEAGRRLAGLGLGAVRLLSGATRRTRETADGLLTGLAEAGHTAPVSPPVVSFALRNPDLYLAGDRVDMVSSPEAFAAQVPGLAPEAVLEVPFFREFLGVPDRIGFWLRCENPPGDDATRVAERIAVFARSLGDAGPSAPDTVVAVTHSPVLRAVSLGFTGADPGEPGYLTGFSVDATADGGVQVDALDPFA